jgi:cold shock CspA family protein
MNKGHLKIWNEDRGFGFIKSESLKCDTFIHISSLKSMSRRPIVGDIIYFEIEKQSDGKNRAVNCRIEGVAVVTKSHEYSATKNKKFSYLTTLIFVLIIGFFWVSKNEF